MEPPAPREQPARERAQPRADLHECLARPRIDRLDDGFAHRLIDQEVLAETLAGHVPHRHPAGIQPGGSRISM
jgi:hypothetical protein